MSSTVYLRCDELDTDVFGFVFVFVFFFVGTTVKFVVPLPFCVPKSILVAAILRRLRRSTTSTITAMTTPTMRSAIITAAVMTPLFPPPPTGTPGVVISIRSQISYMVLAHNIVLCVLEMIQSMSILKANQQKIFLRKFGAVVAKEHPATIKAPS